MSDVFRQEDKSMFLAGAPLEKQPLLAEKRRKTPAMVTRRVFTAG